MRNILGRRGMIELLMGKAEIQGELLMFWEKWQSVKPG